MKWNQWRTVLRKAYIFREFWQDYIQYYSHAPLYTFFNSRNNRYCRRGQTSWSPNRSDRALLLRLWNFQCYGQKHGLSPHPLFHCCGATVLIRCISVSTSFHLSSFPVNMVIFPPSHLGGSVCFHFIMSVNLSYSVCSAHSVYFTTGSDDCLADFFLCLSFFCHFLLRRNA